MVASSGSPDFRHSLYCSYLAEIHSVCLLPQLRHSVPFLHFADSTTASPLSRPFDGGRQGLDGLTRRRLHKLFHLLLNLLSKILTNPSVVGLVETVNTGGESALGADNASNFATQILLSWRTKIR